MPSKCSQSPSDNPQDGPGKTSLHRRGAGDTRLSGSPLSLFLRVRELSLFTNLYVENLIFVCFHRLMVCDSSCFLYAEIIWPHD